MIDTLLIFLCCLNDMRHVNELVHKSCPGLVEHSIA